MMRDKLIELIRKSGCVDTWNYHTDDFKEPNPIEELADILLANGVIVPPCKVGDKVYVITEMSRKIVECVVIGVWIFENKCTIITDNGTIHCDSLGKTVFLTREEAERVLKGGEQE